MGAEYKSVWVRHTTDSTRISYAPPEVFEADEYTQINRGSTYRLIVSDVQDLKPVVFDAIGRVVNLRLNGLYIHLAACTKGFRYGILKSGQSYIWYRYIKEILPITKEDLPLFLHLQTHPYMETLLRKKAL